MRETEPQLLPISAVVPTRNRAEVLCDTLVSLAQQSAQPKELIVIDASDDDLTARVCAEPPATLLSTLLYRRADARGAARQRNQGVALASEKTLFFFDDDVLFEPECVARLWAALDGDQDLGGVSGMLTNQKYEPPGHASRRLFRLLSDKPLASYAGRCLGPGLNLLPEDRDDLPEVVPVEWLNTTSTLYRRSLLPDPPFPDEFTGYSLCEDLVLSLAVGRVSRLANARTARLFHRNCGGDHKSDRAELVRMSIANRYYVMRRVLDKSGFKSHFQFFIWQLFDIVAQFRAQPRAFFHLVSGAAKGLASIARP